MVSLSGTCFWYWNSYYSFLDSCGVPKTLQQKFPKEVYNKYQVMRNILEYLEESNEIEVINTIISNFYKLRNAVDRDALDEKKAKKLLSEFRSLVGNDPIEKEIERQKQEKSRKKYKTSIDAHISQQKRLEDLNSFFTSLITTTEFTPQQRGYK